MSSSNIEEIFGDAIDSYSRADALAAGDMADISNIAKDMGFSYPVALTSSVYVSFLTFPDCPFDFKQHKIRVENGDNRLHVEPFQIPALVSLLNTLKLAIRSCSNQTLSLEFTATYLPDRRDWPKKNEQYIVELHCGDNAEPVMTIGSEMDW